MPSNDKNTLAGYIPARSADALAGKVQGEPVFGVPGKSAYQLAVDNGYEGTVEQWLASLQGPPGVPDPEQVTADMNAWLKENPPNDGEDGGYYIPAVTQPDSNTVQFAFTPSNADMPAVEPVQVALPDSGGNVDQSGLSTTAANLLVTILRDGVYNTDQSSNITALAAELGVTEPEQPDEPDTPVEPDEPAKTLTSISATYSGGDVVVGTAVADLTGISVTAHYSDGTSETVTGYTLSGEIAEGENTVTVTYEGMTATFIVTGVAESSGGDEGKVLDAWTSYEWVEGIHLSGSAGNPPTENVNENYVASEYVSTENVEKIVVTEERGGGLGSYAVFYFDSDKKIAPERSAGGYIRKDNAQYPSPVEIIIPENAAYFRIDSKKADIDGTNTKILVKYTVHLK